MFDWIKPKNAVFSENSSISLKGPISLSILQESQFNKPTKKFEFWHHRPISCFNPATQPIKTIIGRGQVFVFRFDCNNNILSPPFLNSNNFDPTQDIFTIKQPKTYPFLNILHTKTDNFPFLKPDIFLTTTFSVSQSSDIIIAQSHFKIFFFSVMLFREQLIK